MCNISGELYMGASKNPLHSKYCVALRSEFRRTLRTDLGFCAKARPQCDLWLFQIKTIFAAPIGAFFSRCSFAHGLSPHYERPT